MPLIKCAFCNEHGEYQHRGVAHCGGLSCEKRIDRALKHNRVPEQENIKCGSDCGKDAIRFYFDDDEGTPSCGSYSCELVMFGAAEYNEERGS